MKEVLAIFGIVGVGVAIFWIGILYGYQQAEVDSIQYPQHFKLVAEHDYPNLFSREENLK